MIFIVQLKHHWSLVRSFKLKLKLGVTIPGEGLFDETVLSGGTFI